MLKHIYKYIVIIAITIVFSVAFTGSHIVQSVDDLGYVVGLGIDIGDSEDLKITFQFTKPTSSGEGGSSESSPSVIDTVEASSIDAAISYMNAYISKEINLSHCKVIVISEELAQKGIAKEIYSLSNKVQIRPDNHIIITNCSAQEYLGNVSPSLENLVAKFYEILPRSSEYTGYTIDAELGNFFNQLVCRTCEPSAILGNIVSGEDSGNSKKQEDSSSQGSESMSAKNGIENLGIAVFKEDKLVGKLSAEESLVHLLLTNKLKSCNISIPDPANQDKKIDLFLTVSKAPTIKVSIINGNPYIKSNIFVNAKISSIYNLSKDTSHEDSENRLKEIEQSARNYLNNLLYDYLYKTSKEFHADSAGFGKYALKEFKTMNEYEEYDWLNHYQDSFFEANANVEIKSGFLLNGS